MKRNIALISEHASPLTTIGGVDSGGQNVYVGQLARHLAEAGCDVDIFTRWDNPSMPEIVAWTPNICVIHVKAGPVQVLPKEQILPYMPQFTDSMIQFIHDRPQSYDIIHANFFMSALVAANIKKKLHIPFVVTFHALGKVRRLYQKEADKFPDDRFEIEERVVKEADRIIAECPQDAEDLVTHYSADPTKIVIIPGGFDPQEFHVMDKALARMTIGVDPQEKIILQLGRIVKRKGIDNVIRSIAYLKERYGIPARLLVVG